MKNLIQLHCEESKSAVSNLNQDRLTFCIEIASIHRTSCGSYDFGSSISKPGYYGFANSGSSTCDKDTLSTKLICDKRKSGCYSNYRSTNVLNFAFLSTLLSIIDWPFDTFRRTVTRYD